jgi:4-amino-4-deoxy-L-arabinose transferase-like glycosyltransferase
VFFAICAPWFVLVSQANPEFARFFFIHEHFERFLSTTHRRFEPWWFFLPILVGGFGPWMLTLFPAALGAWRRESPAREFAWRRFALIWCAFILVFFSISKSKLPAYILPMFPPLAMLVGEWLERVDSRRLARYLVPVAVIVAAGLAAMWGAPERAKSAWTQELYAAARPYIALGCAGLIVGLAAGTAMALARLKHAAIAIVVAGGMGFVDGVEDGYEQVSPRQSGQDVAASMRPHLTPDSRVYSVDYYDQTIPFYLGREVTLAKYVDEFELGQRSEPTRALPTVQAWLIDFQRPGRALAIMQPGVYDDVLRPAGIPMQLIHRDDRRVVVVKP